MGVFDGVCIFGVVVNFEGESALGSGDGGGSFPHGGGTIQ